MLIESLSLLRTSVSLAFMSIILGAKTVASYAADNNFTIYMHREALPVAYYDVNGTIKNDIDGRVDYMGHFGIKQSHMVYGMAYDYVNGELAQSTIDNIEAAAKYNKKYPDAPVIFGTEFVNVNYDPDNPNATAYPFPNNDSVRHSQPQNVIVPTLKVIDKYLEHGGNGLYGEYGNAPPKTYAKIDDAYIALTQTYAPIAHAVNVYNTPFYNHYTGTLDPDEVGKTGLTWKESVNYGIQFAKSYGTDALILPGLTIGDAWAGLALVDKG